MNGVATSYDDQTSTAPTPSPALETATPTPTPTSTTAPATAMAPMYTSPRNTSGPLAVDTMTTPDSNPTSTPSPWHRSNPHSLAAPTSAPTPSKTSQFIERITAENETLKRELKLERTLRENEARQVSAARSRAEDSRAEFQNLQVLVDANKRALDRKDRKLEEMRTALELETKRRKDADARAEEALSMLGNIRSETQRELAAAYEQRHCAETVVEAVREGYKRVTDAYERKMRGIQNELGELRKQRVEDADRIKRQMIVSDQIQHEVARKLRNETKMEDLMGKYKEEHRVEVDRLVEEAERMRAALPSKEQEAEQVLEEMKAVRDKMKWVMAIKASQEQGGQQQQEEQKVENAKPKGKDKGKGRK
ncbi:hypothetical protein BCR34DRAFT_560133 [Clohesyomyces aquaticus]|uniref:SWI5-dependent HO expression protein 3 n=1 Tax=Clohesyomyces aquaticus TaxID=1231657 RepID=A0A1Y1ZWA5_9PLEO|nr:hypothetical protein BCR34DRAFT_560133 [Clohesyomyces aquaticus]